MIAVTAASTMSDVAHPSAELQVTPRRQLGIGEWILHQVTHARPQFAWRGVEQVAREPHLATVGAQHPQQKAHHGGLPCTVETDERDDLPRVKLEVEVEDARAIAELSRYAMRRPGRDRSWSVTAGEHS